METLNEALVECVKACGGSKQVGASIWPDLAPDQAQRKLLNCLDSQRPEKLSPTQALLILKMARAKGFHGGIAYILSELGYAPTTPIEPRDEAAELSRQAAELLQGLKSVTARLESLQPTLRAIA